MNIELKEELTDKKDVYSLWIVCYRYYLNTVKFIYSYLIILLQIIEMEIKLS